MTNRAASVVLAEPAMVRDPVCGMAADPAALP